jgi:hypothetical protein
MLKLLWYLGDRQKKHEHVALNQPSRGKLRHIKKSLITLVIQS